MTLILNGTDNSATTPAVTGTDTDTGIYYPTSNQVAIATAGTQAMLVDASQNVTFAQAANLPNTFGFKNRIINGAMVIDQRNAGAVVTITANPQYTLDRWFAGVTVASKFSVQQNSAAVTPPAGFIKYLGVVSLAATTPGASDNYYLEQGIEGFNIADLGFGAAGASSVTISFWVRSSLTGTFGAAIANSGGNRSYPFNYTISSANTWTQITQTIPGDTTGTWLTDNGVGLRLRFGLGAGANFQGTAGAWGTANAVTTTTAINVVATNGATFYITGVQLEKGSTATSFDYRSIGTEESLCQRYYYKTKAAVSSDLFAVGWCVSTTVAAVSVPFPVSMRTNPTALEQSGTAANYQTVFAASAAALSAVPVFTTASTNSARVECTVASGLTAGQGVGLRAGSTSAYLAWSAEL